MPNIYGPVNGARKKVEQVYGSVNGARKEVLRAYGSVNGTTKVVFEKETEYGLVEYEETETTYSTSDVPSTITVTYTQEGIRNIFASVSRISLAPYDTTTMGKSIIYVEITVSGGTIPEGELSDGAPIRLYLNDMAAGTSTYWDTTYTRSGDSFKIVVNQSLSSSVNFKAVAETSIVQNAQTKLHELNSTELISYREHCGFALRDGSFIPPTAIKGFSFGESITSIGASFLKNASSLTHISQIPNTVTTIGASFLYGCTSFNQPITIPSSVTTIGDHFLQSCTSFNQPITISSGVTTIGTSFLYGCTSFNQSLTIPSGVTQLNQHFLSGCTSFNQPLTIPSTITRVYREVLENLDSFVGPLTIETSATSSSSQTGRFKTLATTNSSALSYTQGITIRGSQASVWKNAYADENGTSFQSATYYRKLILGS